MTDGHDDFEHLMQQVRNGSDDATLELFELCKDDLYYAIRRKLNIQLRAKFDSEDFVQAVWATFFFHRSVISRFTNAESLISYLVRVAGNKVMEEVRRRLMTQKYNVNRERSLDATNEYTSNSFHSRELAPSENVILKDQWRRLLDGLSPQERQIMEMYASRMKGGEIANELGVHKNTVYRVIRKFCEQLSQ